jgi:tetratricopeptide (TPR) repeat protein
MPQLHKHFNVSSNYSRTKSSELTQHFCHFYLIMNRLYLITFILYAFFGCTNSPSTLFDKAIDLMATEHYEEASTSFSAAIKTDSTYEAAYLYRGLCFQQLKKYQLALNDFNYLIQRHSQKSLLINQASQRIYGDKNHTRLEFIDPYFQRGVTRYFMDSLNSAKTDFEFVLTKSNRISKCRNYLADIYYQQGNLSDACNQIELIENAKTSEMDSLQIEKLKKNYCQ